MPRLTPSVQPRSSAFTIRFFTPPVPQYSYSFASLNEYVPLTEIPCNFSMAMKRKMMTASLREARQAGARYSEKRRGRRMNSRVPVRLEWRFGGNGTTYPSIR